MKKLVTTLTLFLVSVFFVSAHAQRLTSADEVLNTYFNALGGKKALMTINDLILQSIISYKGGSNPLIVKYKSPLNVSITTTDNKGKVTYKQIVNGKQVSTKVNGKVTPVKATELERTILMAQFIPELHLSSKGVKYTLAGTEAINGKKAYKIVYTLASGGTSWTSYYDTQTGLRVQTVVSGENGSVTTTYSEYRAVNGVKLPYHFRVGDSDVQVSKYQMNTSISDAEFAIK